MDIELKDHRKTVAVMRELAGLRTKVPSHGEGDPQGRPPFRAHELDQLRARVRELAQAIVDGGTMGPQRRLDRRIEAPPRLLGNESRPRVEKPAVRERE